MSLTANILHKVIPLLFLGYVLFVTVIFALNNKSLKHTNKYFHLVQYFRWTLYGLIYCLLYCTYIYLKSYYSSDKEEKDQIEELESKIARFVRV